MKLYTKKILRMYRIKKTILENDDVMFMLSNNDVIIKEPNGNTYADVTRKETVFYEPVVDDKDNTLLGFIMTGLYE